MHKKLYKYRTFNCDDAKSLSRTEDIFLKNELYYSSPSSFNDPFDCLVHIDFSRISKNDFWLYYEKNVTTKKPYTLEQKREIFEDGYKSGELMDVFNNSLQDSFNKNGVYSLSSKNDDVLMWSHYSDGHRGYCFEIDTSIFLPTKVKYRKRYPKFDLSNASSSLNILLRTKSTHWKYEREWRYFSKLVGPLEIENNSIKSVIIGSQMDEKNIANLLNIVDKSNHFPVIFQASINKHMYSISISKYET